MRKMKFHSLRERRVWEWGLEVSDRRRKENERKEWDHLSATWENNPVRKLREKGITKHTVGTVVDGPSP